MTVSKSDPILISVSNSLGIKAEWLWNLINFESRWNPLARSGMPYNAAKVNAGIEQPKYARGLIQFIDSTAISLGYDNAEDLVNKHPDYKSQLLYPVRRYLTQYKPFPTEQSLYLAVFYPAARNWSPTREFPDNVQTANPGIRRPIDYVNKVKGEASKSFITSPVIVFFGIIGLLLVFKR